MSAIPAYSYSNAQRQPQRAPQPSIHAIPGGRRSHETGISPQVLLAVKVAMVAIALITVVCCVRVALSAATVATAVETQELNQEITAVREQSNALEVSYSTLVNPSNVKAAATELGMVSADSAETIVLAPDVVATDDAGNLSLTQSLQRAASQGE